MKRKTAVIGSNTSHYVWQARQNLMHAIMSEGYDVVVLAPKDSYSEKLEDMGVRHVDLPMKMNKNPISDLFLLGRFIKLLAQIKPDAYLGYTVKPNVYGSLAAHWLGIPTINNIAGLGTIFVSNGALTKIVKGLYRLALRPAAMVFFQNPDDQALFVNGGIVRHDRYDLLPGSGVDLIKFAFAPIDSSSTDKTLRFLLIARMLWDKGVGEFVHAAKALRQNRGDLQFCLLGGMDNDNPDAISKKQMDEWVDDGNITYLGYCDDVASEIRRSDCIVLPSAYPEGTPRTLLEASAIGRPIITTNAPGCRTAVDEGKNGFLCRLRDADDLKQQLTRIISLSDKERSEMGRSGRAKMEREFDEKIVIQKYIEVLKSLN